MNRKTMPSCGQGRGRTRHSFKSRVMLVCSKHYPQYLVNSYVQAREENVGLVVHLEILGNQDLEFKEGHRKQKESFYRDN